MQNLRAASHVNIILQMSSQAPDISQILLVLHDGQVVIPAQNNLYLQSMTPRNFPMQASITSPFPMHLSSAPLQMTHISPFSTANRLMQPMTAIRSSSTLQEFPFENYPKAKLCPPPNGISSGSFEEMNEFIGKLANSQGYSTVIGGGGSETSNKSDAFILAILADMIGVSAKRRGLLIQSRLDVNLRCLYRNVNLQNAGC